MPLGGDCHSRLTSELDWLLQEIAQAPELAIQELRRESAGRSMQTGYATVWRFVDKKMISFKKAVHVTKQDRPEVIEVRMRWRADQPDLDSVRLVFNSVVPPHSWKIWSRHLTTHQRRSGHSLWLTGLAVLSASKVRISL